MPASTAIGTLRVTGAAADTPALRLRVAHELAGADLAPPGLPPAAVLVVRRLADPLPRRLAGREPRVRPDPAWERAVRDRLAAAARSAARPDGHGELPANAEAVLFADEAELLACVLRELVHGQLAGRWWWRSVRRRLPAMPGIGSYGMLPALLAACPREAPAVLERLARWGEAAAVAAALSPQDAARILAALAAEHGLPRKLLGLENADSFAAVSGAERPPEPWRAWLPAALQGLPWAPEIRCLFGVALGLVAAPHRLRDRDTVRRARRWWQAVAAAPVVPEPVAAPPTSPEPTVQSSSLPASLSSSAGDRRPEWAQAVGTVDAPARTDQLRGESSSSDLIGVDFPAGSSPASVPPPDLTPDPSPIAPPPTGRGAPPPDPLKYSALKQVSPLSRGKGGRWERGAGGVRSGGGTAPATGKLTPVPVAGWVDDGRGAVIEPQQAPQPTVEPTPAPPPALSWAADGIATRIGGVLYLIHALLDLGLPEAFERGWRLASAAGPWGTLDLLGRGLLAERFAEVADDPLWAVLGELAGWGSDAASCHPSPTLPAYRVPVPWLAKLADPGDRFSWSAAGGRLRLWSAAGWLLADVPRQPGPPSRQARRELARVAGGAAGSTRARAADAPLARPLPPLPSGCPARFGPWLAAALPAVRRRLLLALGEGADPAARVLAVPGRVYVTSSHVDLVLPLAAADLVVRRAGLDRDPGWLPAFGRVIYFHFD